MSAAATAAGYLYASGRLRTQRAEQEEQHHERQLPEKPARKEIRVAVLPEREQPRQAAAPAPKKAPKIEYRTRKRWTAE